MYQRALPVLESQIVLGEERAARVSSKVRALVRALVGHVLPLLRWLGQFVAAGGPLS